jgi:uncharacterized protein involved in exopolysaccharide biosynthesis
MQRDSGTGGRTAEAEQALRAPTPDLRAALVLMWRERVLMIVVFAVIFALGTAGVLVLPSTFDAHSSLLVGLGQEYVYQPRAGDAARGAVPQVADVVQSEVEILSSDELKRRVIHTLGMDVVAPKLAGRWAASDPVRRRMIEGVVVRNMARSLKIDTTPDTGVVRLTYRGASPDASAQILNTLVDAYLGYRREVLTDPSSPLITREKALFEQKLAVADKAFQDFQSANGIGDFPTEKTALAALHQSIIDDRYKAEASLSEATSRLAALSRGLAAIPSEIELQRDLDLTAPDKLMQLKIDRRDLLSRYKPGAAPVKEIDAKIAALEAFIAQPGSSTDREKRMGANPVRQEVARERIDLEAQAAAARRRRDELTRQLEDVTRRQQHLAELESRYQALTTERDVLQASVRNFEQRAEEAQAAQELAKNGDDSVRVVERAAPPVEAQSLKRPLFVLALLFALFSAACAGLIRGFLRGGFTAPAEAGRVLDLPVLATVPLKRA